jgi:DNA end-binding protein Ku
MEFVPLEEIDPMFFDRPYYLEPQKKGAKAYALLREALKRAGKVGIAKVVIKTRQHLAAVRPQKNLLVLELMHFEEELVDPSSLQIPGAIDLAAKEMEMATELIKRMSGQWHPEKYTDDYRHALLNLIQKKIEHGDRALEDQPAPKRPSTKVIDLVSILQESLNKAGKGSKAAAAKTTARRAPKHKLKKAA